MWISRDRPDSLVRIYGRDGYMQTAMEIRDVTVVILYLDSRPARE